MNFWHLGPYGKLSVVLLIKVGILSCQPEFVLVEFGRKMDKAAAQLMLEIFRGKLMENKESREVEVDNFVGINFLVWV